MTSQTQRTSKLILMISALFLAISLGQFASAQMNPYSSPSPSVSETPSPSPSESATPSPSVSPAVSTVMLQTRSGANGTYITDGQGMSLYVFSADSANTSNCSDSCAAIWQPLTVPNGQTVQAASDVLNNLIGTITRSDGSQQVTYSGQPLYHYSGDQNAGDTNGQGLVSSGGTWYLVKVDGSRIEASAAGTAGGSGTTTGTDGTAGTTEAAGTAGTTGTTDTSVCMTTTDAYGNVTYSGNCTFAGTTPVSTCTTTTDAYGNMFYSGTCAGTIVYPGNGGHGLDHDHNHDHEGHGDWDRR